MFLDPWWMFLKPRSTGGDFTALCSVTHSFLLFSVYIFDHPLHTWCCGATLLLFWWYVFFVLYDNHDISA